MIKKLLLCAVLFALLLPCATSSAPQKSDDAYILPYPIGASYKLIQGNNGPWGHKGHSEFAYDFLLPMGSTVTAARSGEVVKVVESFNDGTRKGGEENLVVIKHADGTFARYYHLTRDGAIVSTGNHVSQGQKIGLSGNSGNSAGPHLHFDVTTGCYDWGCQTIKVRFENARENPLKEGETYEALR